MMITVQCPAKVNLTLKIKNKRPDGFHNIESIMQTISLYDYLTVDVKPNNNFEIKLSGNNPDIPYDERNLVYKAAMLFFDTATNQIQRQGYEVNIYIDKHIPIAAGLAGGSTDAAGTLLALNEIFDKPFGKNQLHELCAKLGSDLNVCLEGGKLFCKGRGEIIEPMEFEEFELSLIKPENLGISAKEAYGKFAQKNKFKELIRSFAYSLIRYSNNNYKKRKTFFNDLEWAIIDDYKELQTIKKLYPKSMMSGSGSTYFIIGDTFESLEGYRIFNNLKSENKGCCIINRS